MTDLKQSRSALAKAPIYKPYLHEYQELCRCTDCVKVRADWQKQSKRAAAIERACVSRDELLPTA